MSSTLAQSSLNFTQGSQDNVTTASSSTNEQTDKQLVIKNLGDLSRDELGEFLKVRSHASPEKRTCSILLQQSGATNVQSGDTDDALLVTYASQSDAEKVRLSHIITLVSIRAISFRCRKTD